MCKEWNQMVAWAESCNESKLEKEVDFSYLENFYVFSSKMTCNVLHPNMAFHLKFSLDQKRWQEVDLLNGILKLEPFKISKNWESYDLLKLEKFPEMTYNLLHP